MEKLHVRQVTVVELKRAGIPIHSGTEYFKDWPRPKRKVSLERVRAILARVPGSLAEQVSEMRDEEG